MVSTLSRLVLVKHVFPTFWNAKISISIYEIAKLRKLILAFLEKIGNKCSTSTRRDIIAVYKN